MNRYLRIFLKTLWHGPSLPKSVTHTSRTPRELADKRRMPSAETTAAAGIADVMRDIADIARKGQHPPKVNRSERILPSDRDVEHRVVLSKN